MPLKTTGKREKRIDTRINGPAGVYHPKGRTNNQNKDNYTSLTGKALVESGENLPALRLTLSVAELQRLFVVLTTRHNKGDQGANYYQAKNYYKCVRYFKFLLFHYEVKYFYC